MIKSIKKNEYSKYYFYINDKKYENVYLYIDVSEEGFDSENIKSYVCYNNDDGCVIIYNYYNSLQLLQIGTVNDAVFEEIANYIDKNGIKRTSGPSSLIHSIGKYINCNITDGYIMTYVNNEFVSDNDVEEASISDLAEMARIICNDSHLGIGYDYDNLYSQLKDRRLNQGCKNYIIRINNNIVSHFASYAISNDVAVLSGMVTLPEFRGKGLGSKLIKTLSSEIKFRDGKEPYLYCYEQEYYTWYVKLGYSTVGTTSKLEYI